MEDNQENKNVENENTQNTNSDTSSTEETFKINAEDIKKETKETVNQVKDTFKNVNIKNETKEAKGFFFEFFKNPIQSIKSSSSQNGNKFFKIAIIILAVWLIAIFLSNILGAAGRYLFGYLGSFSFFFKNLFANIFGVIGDLIAPVIGVALISGLVYGFQKNKSKSFVTILSTVLIAKIPVVIASILGLLTVFGNNVTSLINPFSGFCNTLSVVLLYFGIKYLLNEENDTKSFWKFALIMGIFYIVQFIFSFIHIYL